MSRNTQTLSHNRGFLQVLRDYISGFEIFSPFRIEITPELKQRREDQRNKEITYLLRYICVALGLPLWLLYTVADYYYSREHFSQLVSLRLLIIPTVLFVLVVSHNLKKTVAHELLATFFTAVQSSIMTALIYTGHDFSSPYYIGLNHIAAGMLAFVPWSAPFWIFNLIILYGPYYAIGFIYDRIDSKESVVLHSASFITVVAILSVYKYILSRTQLKELQTQLLLEKELENRNATIQQKTREQLDLAKEKYETEIAVKQLDARLQVAREVEHDIRSPLAALRVAMKLPNLENYDARVLLQSATARISDILSDLSKTADTERAVFLKDPQSASQTESGAFESELAPLPLAPLIADVISEKRIQYQLLAKDVQLNASFSDFERLLAIIDRGAFMRSLSNLIQNAYEALPAMGGVIRLDCRRNGSTISITVTDTGCGIPAAIRNEMGKRPVTFGKSNGAGLGYYQATKAVHLLGGKLAILATSPEGTVLELSLPAVEAPPLFGCSAEFLRSESIVIIDDDEAVFHQWLERFGKEKQLHWIGSPEAFDKAKYPNEAFYIVDLDFKGSRTTGIDLIENNQLLDVSFLSTASPLTKELLLVCQLKNIRIYPKQYLSI